MKIHANAGAPSALDQATVLPPGARRVWPNCVAQSGYLILSGRWNARAPDRGGPRAIGLEVTQGDRHYTRSIPVEAAEGSVTLGFYNDGMPWALSLALCDTVENAADAEVELTPLDVLIAVVDPVVAPRLFAFEVDRVTGADRPLLIAANQGGMMNRLVPMLSTLGIARRAGLRAAVWWTPTSHCAAEFDDLFDLPGSRAREIDANDAIETVDFFYDYPGTHLAAEEPLDVHALGQTTVVQSSVVLKVAGIEPSDLRQVGAEFRTLALSDAVTAKLARFDGQDFSRTLGFHIRRPYPGGAFAEMEQRKFGVPLETFVTLVEALRRLCPQFERVLVCTNDFATETAMLRHFGKYVLTYTKESIDNTTDPVAVQDAVVDLMLMSRCPTIFSQSTTAFAMMASAIGGGDLFCMTEQSTADTLDFWVFEAGLHRSTVSTPRADLDPLKRRIDQGPIDDEEARRWRTASTRRGT